MSSSKIQPGPLQVEVGRRIADINSPLKSPLKTTATAPAVKRNAGTLVDAWADATRYFEETAKRKLTTNVSAESLDQAIGELAAEFEAKPQKSLRRRRLDHLGRNVIDGILAVGGIAAEAASPAFPPAGLCFCALSFVIGASRRISGVFDLILELFEEIEDFLVIFKILRRIDGAKRLDSDMIEKATKMLISLVQICALATNMIEHKKWTSFKAAVLSNESGAADELKKFQKLARKLDQLTNTVSLESLVHIESVVVESKDHLEFIATSARDQKTEKVNASRLQKIDERIWVKKERDAAKAVMKAPEYEEELIDGTLESLQSQPGYKEWSSNSERPVFKGLCLTGDSGTGKSRMLHALRDHLDQKRQTWERGMESTYVAYYSFDYRTGGATGPSGNAASTKSSSNSGQSLNSAQSLTALRSVAYQIARQSTRYAMALEKAIEDDRDKGLSLSQEKNVMKLWERLQLSKFDAPEGATVYLLFDDVDWVKEHKTLFKVLTNLQQPSQDRNERVDIRSFFTGSANVNGNVCQVITTNATTKDLIPRYTESEMARHRIFQHNDKRSQAYKQRILDAAEGRDQLDYEQEMEMWSFRVVQRQIQRIKPLHDRSASASELTALLQMKPSLVQDQTAKDNLEHLVEILSPEQKTQINYAIMWILYNVYGDAFLEDVEAILNLADCGDSLQSFTEQVGSHLSGLFEKENDVIRLKPEYEEIIRQREYDPVHLEHKGQPHISLNMSIKDVEEAVVRNFVWQLNDGISSGKFDFATYAKQASTPIYANKLEGDITIVKLCLKLLNEGWTEETSCVLFYARSYTPQHFFSLNMAQESVPRADRIAVTQGVVEFLRDPYHLLHDPERHFGAADDWLENTIYGTGLRRWLAATCAEASSSDRRWINSVLHIDQGPNGYLKDVARAVAKKWITHSKANARDRYFEGDRVRTSGSLETNLFRYLNDYLDGLESEGEDTLSNHEDRISNHEDRLSNHEDRSSNHEMAQEEESRAEGSNHGSHEDKHEGQASTSGASMTVPTSCFGDQAAESVETSPKEADPAKSSDEVVDSATSTHTPEPPVPMKQDKVQRALRWAQEHDGTSQAGGQFFINIGYTYSGLMDIEEFEEARPELSLGAKSHFSSALELSDFRWQALAGLGRVNYALGEREEAIRLMSEAVDILAANQISGTMDETDKTVHGELLREAGTIHEELEQQDEAIRYYSDSLEIREDDFDLRCKVLHLICKQKSADLGLELLSKWSEPRDGDQESLLVEAIYQSVTSDTSCTKLEDVVIDIQNERIATMLRDFLGEVVEVAKKRSQMEALPGLLSCQGIAQGRTSDVDCRSLAVKHWTEALILASDGDDDNAEYHHYLYVAARGLALHEFEHAKAQLADVSLVSATDEEKTAIARHLGSQLNTFRPDSGDYWASRAREAADHFVTSIHFLLGQIDEFRQRTRIQMDTASEILLDDDPENDLEGIQGLLRLFCATGDEVGALTAFSLLDRRARLKGLEKSPTSPTAPTAPISPSSDDEGRMSPAPGIDYVDFINSDHLPHRMCISCGNYKDSTEPDGIWWCQFCSQVELCNDCHQEFVDGRVNLHFCGPDHNFIHLFHTNYEPEEIAEDKVKIGWTRVDQDDGTFKRGGGEVVPVSTWLERLRVDWGLPPRPENIITAQK